MEFIQYRKKKNVIMITPKHKTDLMIFKHCSGGLDAVTTKIFNKMTPLLFMHRVSVIHITNEI